jgi:hypothetical protein
MRASSFSTSAFKMSVLIPIAEVSFVTIRQTSCDFRFGVNAVVISNESVAMGHFRTHAPQQTACLFDLARSDEQNPFAAKSANSGLVHRSKSERAPGQCRRRAPTFWAMGLLTRQMRHWLSSRAGNGIQATHSIGLGQRCCATDSFRPVSCSRMSKPSSMWTILSANPNSRGS